MLLASPMLAWPVRAAALERSPAIETFHHLREELARDEQRADWEAFLAAAHRQKAFLNGSPASRLSVARAQLQLGRRGPASAEVQGVLAMGQASDILDTPPFAPLTALIEPQLARNRSSLSFSTPEFRLADPAVLPEDIDYDPVSSRFILTSVLQHKIFFLDRSGRQGDFAVAPDPWPVMAIKVDSKRRLVWATEVALDGFTTIPRADWGRSALLEFDLDRGTLLARHEGPAHSALADMALAPNGDPVLSDGQGGGIYRLRDSALVRIDHGDFISPQTIAVCGGRSHVFVPDYVRGIADFDLDTAAVRWLSTQDRFALNGIDGLYCRGGALVAVQNGTNPERVTRFMLNASMSTIVAETVIERSTRTLGDPTHGVFVGAAFFYIANSGWDALDDHGVRRPAAQLTAAIIMRQGGP